MALTPTQEAGLLELLAQQAELLSLAANENTIISNLGASDVSLADLDTASSLSGADLLLVRQGSQDKAAPASVLAAYSQAGALIAANNLSDVNSSTTARANIGAAALAGDATQSFSAATPVSGSNTTAVITSAWAKLGFAVSLGANGYIKFPTWLGGLVIQWANITVAGATTTTFSFPLAFPTAGYAIVSSSKTPGGTDAYNSKILGTTQYEVQNSGAAARDGTIIAIGS
jgi:hypothetical protein